MNWYEIKAATDKKPARIMVYGYIGQTWDGRGVEAKKFIDELNALDVDAIDLHINSGGGQVFEGTAIYNALKAHRAKITVRIDGIAASIASIIAMAGDTVEMPENAMMMIHDPMGVVAGTSEDMEKMADVLDKLKTGLIATYHEKTGVDAEDLSTMMTDETWMTAGEAVKLGFADVVIGRVEATNNFGGEEILNQYRNVPQNLTAVIGQKQQPEARKEEDMKTFKAEEINADLIKAEFPEIAKALAEDGKPETLKAGATAERERIQGVLEQSIPGHEDLVNSLAFDGKTTPAEAAIKVLAAEKKIRATTIDNHAADAPKPVEQPSTDDDAPAPVKNLSPEDRWEKDPKVRAEFDDDKDAFLAYAKANASGQVRIQGKK